MADDTERARVALLLVPPFALSRSGPNALTLDVRVPTTHVDVLDDRADRVACAGGRAMTRVACAGDARHPLLFATRAAGDDRVGHG